MKAIAFLAMALAACLVSACGDRLTRGGDATETGNARVAGIVVMEDGIPVAGAEVLILPSDFNPVGGAAVPDSQKDTTDGSGRYRFTKLRDGDYNLQFQHRGLRTRSLLFGIKLAKDSVSVPKDTLHAPGGMSVPLPETRDSGVGYVYIPGTTYRKRVDSEVRIVGSVLLDSVPRGLIPMVQYTKGEGASKPVKISGEVEVASGEITHVGAFATWAHSAKLVLNTSPSGVPTSAVQTDFPLLVRLASPAFDFSAAAAGGADLRFSKADGTPLTREIASWDSQAGKADIWVRVDSVHAGKAAQYITMHWGKSEAVVPRYRSPVFDTLAGFAGAWHLDEEAADSTANGLYLDATGAGSNGNDRVMNRSRAGVVGAGHGIDSGDYIQAPKVYAGFRLTSHFTLSSWYRTTLDSGSRGQDIISIGDNYGLRVRDDSIMHFWYYPAVPNPITHLDWNEVNVRNGAFVDGNWHLVCGTYDGSVLRLYVDGKEMGSNAAPEPVGFIFPINVTLGKHGNGKTGFYFAGDLDEPQVHSAVRGPDWNKLSYENQKPGSRFPALAMP
jgi:hypothetical protein